MSSARIDLGASHTLRYIAHLHATSRDRALNPQYEGTPAQDDVPRYCAIITHPLRGGDTLCADDGECSGVIVFASPASQFLDPGRPKWQVHSWEPLTVTPSLLCHCGDHGFITDGRWVSA